MLATVAKMLLSMVITVAMVKVHVAKVITTVIVMTLVAIGAGRTGSIRSVEVGEGLTHLIVDKESGALFLGGINRVYELSPELQVVQEAVMGPRLDSPDCLPPPEVCTFPRHLTPNHNKLLLLVPHLHLVITCGSVYQGACETRPLLNLSQPHTYYTADDVANFAVAANSAEASTVGMVAPGVGGEQEEDGVLYVAVTYTGISRTTRLYRDQVPAISSRSLHGEHRFNLASLTSPLRGKSSSIFLKSKVRVAFPIHYVTVFSDSGFTYFLAVQKASVEDQGDGGRKVSKLIQVCQRDVNFFSYADVPLHCRQHDKDYNVLEAAGIISPGQRLREALGIDKDGDREEQEEEEKVLVAAFSRQEMGGGGGGGGGEAEESALCVYRLTQVRARLLENIKLCHHGNTSVSGGGYLRVGPRGNCNRPSGLVRQKLESGEHYLCNSNLESFSNVVGIVPVSGRPILHVLGQRITALALTQIHQHTVAFLGTNTGRLKKVVVSGTRTREYREDQVTAENSAILTDMVMDPRHRHVYVLTSTTISKVAVEDCGGQSTCNGCLGHGDPFCGWCSLEKRCTVQALCPHAERSGEGRWLQGGGDLCIHITSVTPPSASVTRLTQLHLTIPQLPVSAGYRCVWSEAGWSARADLWYFGARCLSPDFSTLNVSVSSGGSRTVTLGLESEETGHVFVSTNFTFYNCSNFHTCTECTESAFDCHWCVYENSCYHDTGTCQPLVVAGKTSSGDGEKGSKLCPRINTQMTGAIFVPEGVASTLMLVGHNLPDPKSEDGGYRCVVNTGSLLYPAPGKRVDDHHLTCSLPQMYYRGSEGVHTADLTVYWDRSFKLDNSARLVVRVYRCGVLGEGECSVCSHLNISRPHLTCVWCQGQCTHPHRCPPHPHSLPAHCPPPRITKVSPLSGPANGGTNVTIEGRDLGTSFEDIEKGVRIGGVPCSPFAHLYLPARKIVCWLEGRGQEGAGPVQVTVTPHRAVTFPKLFHFRSPVVRAIHPHHGSRGGGSRLTSADQYLGSLCLVCWTTLIAFCIGKM